MPLLAAAAPGTGAQFGTYASGITAAMSGFALMEIPSDPRAGPVLLWSYVSIMYSRDTAIPNLSMQAVLRMDALRTVVHLLHGMLDAQARPGALRPHIHRAGLSLDRHLLPTHVLHS